MKLQPSGMPLTSHFSPLTSLYPFAMQNTLKDKRTKDQIIQLLDRALEQEERLGEKIVALENELAICRKKVDNPIHEFAEEALASSKISFRIDYYRTSENGPLKGVIEHLPSRTNKSFAGDGLRIFSKFMAKYLPELEQVQQDNSARAAKNSPLPEAPAATAPPVIPARQIQPRQSLMNRLMTEFKQVEM